MMIPMTACGSSSTTPSPPAGPCAVQPTSTITEAHTHAVCVLAADLSNPPKGGASYTTTVTRGHTHGISISADQLRHIQAGQLVTVTTTATDSLTHEFFIAIPAGNTPDPNENLK